MRTLLITAALLLAACSPAPAAINRQRSRRQQPSQQTPENPDAAALGATPQTGAWSLRTDEGTTARGLRRAGERVSLDDRLRSRQRQISIYQSTNSRPIKTRRCASSRAVQTLDLPARSFNEGLPSVTAEVPDSSAAKAPLISMLGAPTDRFAIEVHGEAHVFRGHEAVARGADRLPLKNASLLKRTRNTDATWRR
jgi:hypothetical protein